MILTTPEQISYFRLASMKQRVKLESLGMKSRGISIRAHMIKELKLKRNTSYQDVIEAIDTKLSEMLASMQHVEE